MRKPLRNDSRAQKLISGNGGLTEENLLEMVDYLNQNKVEPGDWIVLTDGTRWYMNKERVFLAPVKKAEQP